MTIRMIQRSPIVVVPFRSTTRLQRPTGRFGYGRGSSRSIAGLDAETVAELDELGSGARGAWLRRRALGAEHHVLRGVLGGDELHHLDAVARDLEGGGAKCVGDEVGLPTEEQARAGAGHPSRAPRSGRRARDGSTARARSHLRRAERRPRSPRRSRCRTRAATRAGRSARRSRSRRSSTLRTVPRRSRATMRCRAPSRSPTGLTSIPTSSTRVPTSRPYATRARLMYALPQPASTTRMRSRSQIGSGRRSST